MLHWLLFFLLWCYCFSCLGITFWRSRQSACFPSSSIYSWNWHGGWPLCCNFSIYRHWTLMCGNQGGIVVSSSFSFCANGANQNPLPPFLNVWKLLSLSPLIREYLQSTLAQAIVTIANVCAMIFVIITGAYLGFKTGWTGYELPTGYVVNTLYFYSLPLY